MPNRLLLADGDPKTLRVLDVSLRGAGFEVRTAATGTEAWAAFEQSPPDVMIAATALPELDGFGLCARVRGHAAGTDLPFLFLGTDSSVAFRIKSIEAGADDYLVKPVYIQEVVTRVRSLLQRRDRQSLTTNAGANEAFTGRLTDITVVDLLQLIESGGRSGIVHLRGTRDTPATVYFRQGQVVDAEVGRLSGENAIGRLFSWTDGTFEIEWKSIRRPNAIGLTTAELVLEGMKRLDDRNRLASDLPDLNGVFEVNYRVLAERLSEIPDEVNAVLRLFDGVRSLAHVVDDSHLPDLEAMAIVIQLRDEGIVHDLADAKGGRAPAPAPAARKLTSLGAGSGPVQQSFADRLAETQPVLAAQLEGEEPDDALPPPSRSKTDPGLGRPLGQPELDEAERSLDQALVETDAIPEPRRREGREEGNVIRFPVANQPDGSGPMDLAATLPLGRAADIQRRLTEPMPLVLVPPPPPAPPPPSELSPLLTQRGIAPFTPPPPTDGEAITPAEPATSGESPVPEPPAAAVAESATDPAPEAPTDAAPTPVAEVAPTTQERTETAVIELAPAPAIRTPDQATDGQTTLVNFPDQDISSSDALDELGVPGWRRGAQILAAALVVGTLAAVGVHRFRAGGKPASTNPGAAAQHEVGPAKPPVVENPAAVPPPSPPPAPSAPAVEGNIPSAPLPPAAEAKPPAAEAKPNPPVTAPEKPPEPPSAPAEPVVAKSPTPVAEKAAAPVEVAAAPKQAPGPEQASPDKADAPAPLAPAVTPSLADFPKQLADCRSQFLRNRIRDAATTCAAAVAANPRSADALTMLAHVELNKGRLEHANELAQQSIALDPNQADAYVIIGGVHQDSGRNGQAKIAYRRYLELAPHGRYADELRSIVGSL
ncbi:MAG TPA: DUF4388 domain-containing protein [Polyangia bacterium]|jgi:CheY-like chemotaxis protein